MGKRETIGRGEADPSLCRHTDTSTAETHEGFEKGMRSRKVMKKKRMSVRKNKKKRRGKGQKGG
jgi:hypothetical protein